MPDPFVIGVVVGVTPDRWVRVWRERLPRTPLEVVAVDDVAAAFRGRVDMAFARLPIDDDTVHVIALWEETPVVVAAKDHPVKLFDEVSEADLADEELYPGWDDAVLDVVAAGHGIARMPQSVFRATGRRDVIARPVSDGTATRIGLVWPKDAGGPLVDEFIGIVRGRTANSSRGEAAPPQQQAREERPAEHVKGRQRRIRKPPGGGRRR